MTLRELTYNILDLSEGGRAQNSEYYNLRQFAHWIHNYRNLFLYRDAKEGGRDLQEFEQELSVDLEVVTTSEDRTCVGLCDGYVLRSTTTIPTTVNVKGQYGVMGVWDSALNPIELTRFYQNGYRRYNRVTSNLPYAFIVRIGDPPQTRLYIVNDPGVNNMLCGGTGDELPLTCVIVRAIFADPTALDVCNYDDEYPIAPSMTQRVCEAILKNELPFLMRAPTVTSLEQVAEEKPV
jgi:hypothetical protein